MLVNAKQTPIVQPPQRTDMDPTTAAASALYSGLIQSAQNNAVVQTVQNSANVQASGLTSATQQVTAANTISDNVNEAFAKTRVALQAAGTSNVPTYGDTTAMTDFKDYMSKSPEQRLHDSILKEMGLTEADVKAMPPAQQQAIGKEMAQRVQDKLKLATTGNADSSSGSSQVMDKFLASL
ncbi:Minor capsid protein [Pseudomonas sp. IT-P253]|jgi:hypothetical protein|uniref:hypothetical protein n=1 Tax=Pseudomonas sp. IT-P253 TaxID=3026455 RepID=UPI0039E00807